MAQGKLFLERGTYRRRRMMDAVRLLPLLGLALWLVPLLWPLPEDSVAPLPMSVALRYVFGVWAGLILCCWLLGRGTKEAAEEAGDGAPPLPSGDVPGAQRGATGLTHLNRPVGPPEAEAAEDTAARAGPGAW